MKKKVFLVYFIVTLLFFGILAKLEYATDTYAVFNFDSNAIYMQYAMSGRFITAIIGKILKTINISEHGMYIGSWILAIICAVFSQYKLYKITDKDIKSKTLKFLIPTIIIINPFSIELFLFIEKGIMWFGILISILALENLIKFFEEKYMFNLDNKNLRINIKTKYKYLLYAIIFMFLANCCYQGVVGIFVSIALVYIIKYSKNFKQFFINNFIVGCVYGVPAITNFFIVKLLFKSSRINGEIILSESVQKIFINIQKLFKNMFMLLPKNVFILAILFTFIVFCCKILISKGKFIKILQFIYIIVGITFVAVVPQFLQPTNSIWFVPRSTYCFASLYGVLVLFIEITCDLKKFSKIAIITVSVILLILELQKFIQIEQDRFLLNKKDEQIAMQIIGNIYDYEAKTGKKITKLAVYQDSKPNFTYNGIFATGDMNVKCFATDWSTVEILKYYLRKDEEERKKDSKNDIKNEISLTEKNKEIAEKLKKRNWDEFSEEQLIFQDNVLHFCNY